MSTRLSASHMAYPSLTSPRSLQGHFGSSPQYGLVRSTSLGREGLDESSNSHLDQGCP